MRNHNYQPSTVARTLSTHRTRTLGLIISNITNPFFTDLAQGAIEAAPEMDCILLVASAAHDAHDLPEQVEMLMREWVSGIFIATQPLPDGMLNRLPFGNTPLVIMDHGQAPPPNAIGLVSFDWRGGAYAATRHLLQQGHGRIGYVGGIPDRSSTREREEGYRQALAEAGIPFDPGLIYPGDFLTESGYRGALKLLRASPSAARQVTALLMANDLMALGALQAIGEAGLRVPDEISVVGMDDTFFTAFLSPPLTTVHVPTQEAGRQGIQMLAEMPQASDPLRRLVLPTRLVVRRSTTPSQLAETQSGARSAT